MNSVQSNYTRRNPYDYLGRSLTDLQPKIDEVLREIKDQVPNAVCFALTDQLLTYYTSTMDTSNAEDIVVDQGEQIKISIQQTRNIPTQDGGHTAVLVKINPEIKQIEFTVSIMIFFYRGTDHFASCNVQFSMKGTPKLNIDFLEFAITDIVLMTPQTSQTIFIVNQKIIDDVYQSIDGFVDYVNDLLEKFKAKKSTDSTPEVDWVIPALINTIHLPDDWRFLQQAVLHSPQFFYKEVRLMGATNGCLFVVFTAESTHEQFPCNCDDFGHFINLSQVNDSRRHVAIGISQDALFEILKPLVDNALNISHTDSTGNGEIRAELTYWIRGFLNSLTLSQDGINCTLNQVDTGGYVAAAVKMLKRNIWKRKLGLKVQLNQVGIDIKQFQLVTSKEETDVKVSAKPEVTIGDINVELQPDEPLLEWIIEMIKNAHKKPLCDLIEKSLKFSSFKKPRQRYESGIMETEFAYAEFFDNSSMVLTMQVQWIN